MCSVTAYFLRFKHSVRKRKPTLIDHGKSHQRQLHRTTYARHTPAVASCGRERDGTPATKSLLWLIDKRAVAGFSKRKLRHISCIAPTLYGCVGASSPSFSFAPIPQESLARAHTRLKRSGCV